MNAYICITFAHNMWQSFRVQLSTFPDSRRAATLILVSSPLVPSFEGPNLCSGWFFNGSTEYSNFPSLIIVSVS